MIVSRILGAAIDPWGYGAGEKGNIREQGKRVRIWSDAPCNLIRAIFLYTSPRVCHFENSFQSKLSALVGPVEPPTNFPEIGTRGWKSLAQYYWPRYYGSVPLQYLRWLKRVLSARLASHAFIIRRTMIGREELMISRKDMGATLAGACVLPDLYYSSCKVKRASLVCVIGMCDWDLPRTTADVIPTWFINRFLGTAKKKRRAFANDLSLKYRLNAIVARTLTLI